MAQIYPTADQDLGAVSRALLDLAGDDPSLVVYRPGVGVQGVFEVPDDLAGQYNEAQAAEIGEPDEEAEEAKPRRGGRRRAADVTEE